MNMNPPKKMLLIILMLLLTSCSYVVSIRPVGIENSPINPEDWNGFWLCDGNILKIKVIDDSKSIVKLAWFEDKNNDLEPQSVTLKIMKGKKWTYANILELEGEKAKDEYLWGRISNEKEKIVFWHPLVRSFAEAAESKKIEAIIHRKLPAANGEEVSQDMMPDSITLTDQPEAIVDLIENGGSKYFDWENPVTFTRIIK
jgi:hypothetical protein